MTQAYEDSYGSTLHAAMEHWVASAKHAAAMEARANVSFTWAALHVLPPAELRALAALAAASEDGALRVRLTGALVMATHASEELATIATGRPAALLAAMRLDRGLLASAVAIAARRARVA